MKTSEIQARMKTLGPNAEFALKPASCDTFVCLVRGLQPSPRPGVWLYSEVRYKGTITWQASSLSVTSQVLTTPELALAQTLGRAKQHEREAANRMEIRALTERLDTLGVQAAVSGQHLAIYDWRALSTLLDRLEG